MANKAAHLEEIPAPPTAQKHSFQSLPMLAKTIGIHQGLSNKPKMTSRMAGPHFSEAAMWRNQSHAS